MAKIKDRPKKKIVKIVIEKRIEPLRVLDLEISDYEFANELITPQKRNRF